MAGFTGTVVFAGCHAQKGMIAELVTHITAVLIITCKLGRHTMSVISCCNRQHARAKGRGQFVHRSWLITLMKV
jgi:hypothetical protein